MFPFPSPLLMLASAIASVWTTVLTMNGSSNNSWANLTIRETIPNAALTDANGSQVRITIRASATSALGIAKIFIGLKGTNPGDFASAPTQLFYGGSAGISLTAGQSSTTDAAAFSYDGTHDLVVMVVTTGTSGFEGVTTGTESIVFKAGDDSASLAVSGYSSAATKQIINKIEALVP